MLNASGLMAMLHKLVQNLTRVTSGGSFIPEIDGLRFIAIFPVVMHHLLGTFLVVTKKMESTGGFNWNVAGKEHWLIHIISHGNYGVQIFFVISGFILALPFARKHFGIGFAPNMKMYFLRRVSRLEPTYLVNLSIIFMFFVFVYNLAAVPLIPHLFATMSYLHNQIYASISTISDVTWSLEVEIQFYILAPFLALVFKLKNTMLRRLVLIFVIILFSVLSPYHNHRVSLSLINFIQYFTAGFLLADYYLLDWHEKPTRNFTGDLLGLVGLTVLFCAMFELLSIMIVLPFAIFLFFIGVFKGRATNKVFNNKGLVVIGGMCYTIYLYHNVIINNTLPYIIKIIPNSCDKSNLLSGFGLVSLMVLPIVLLICSILFILFERPFMKKDWYKFNKKKTDDAVLCFNIETNT